MSTMAIQSRDTVHKRVKEYLAIHNEMLSLLRKYPPPTTPIQQVVGINDSFQTVIMTPSPNSKGQMKKPTIPRTASSCATTEIMSPSPTTKQKRNCVPSPCPNPQLQLQPQAQECTETPITSRVKPLCRQSTQKVKRSATKVHQLSAKLSRTFLDRFDQFEDDRVSSDAISSENESESQLSHHRNHVEQRLKRKRSFHQFIQKDPETNPVSPLSQMLPQDLTNALYQCRIDGQRPLKRRKKLVQNDESSQILEIRNMCTSPREQRKQMLLRYYDMDGPIDLNPNSSNLNGLNSNNMKTPPSSKRTPCTKSKIVKSIKSKISPLSLRKTSRSKRGKKPSVKRTRTKNGKKRSNMTTENLPISPKDIKDTKAKKPPLLRTTQRNPISAKRTSKCTRIMTPSGSIIKTRDLKKITKSKKTNRTKHKNGKMERTLSSESNGSCESIESSSPTIIKRDCEKIKERERQISGQMAMKPDIHRNPVTRRSSLRLTTTESPRYEMNDPDIFGLLPGLDEVDEVDEVNEVNEEIEDKQITEVAQVEDNEVTEVHEVSQRNTKEMNMVNINIGVQPMNKHQDEHQAENHEIDEHKVNGKDGNHGTRDQQQEEEKVEHMDRVNGQPEVIRFENHVRSPFAIFRRSAFNNNMMMKEENENRKQGNAVGMTIITKQHRFTPLFKASRELCVEDKQYQPQRLNADYESPMKRFSANYLEKNHISPTTMQAQRELNGGEVDRKEESEEDEKGDIDNSKLAAPGISSGSERSLFDNTNFSDTRIQVNSLLRDTESEGVVGDLIVKQDNKYHVFEYPSSHED